LTDLSLFNFFLYSKLKHDYKNNFSGSNAVNNATTKSLWKMSNSALKRESNEYKSTALNSKMITLNETTCTILD